MGHKVGVCCRNLLHVVIMSLITEYGVLYLEVPLFCMENLPVPAAAAIAAAAAVTALLLLAAAAPGGCAKSVEFTQEKGTWFELWPV